MCMSAPKIPAPQPPPPPPAPPAPMTERIKPTASRRRKSRFAAESGVARLTIPRTGTDVGPGY